MENKNKPEFLLIRYNMRATLANFSKVVERECRSVTCNNRELIEKELLVAAEKFAVEYGELQSKYAKLLFLEDLSEVASEEAAELCLKFMEKEEGTSLVHE